MDIYIPTTANCGGDNIYIPIADCHTLTARVEALEKLVAGMGSIPVSKTNHDGTTQSWEFLGKDA